MVAHDFTYPLGHIITAKFWQNVENDGLHFTVSDSGWAKSVWGKIYGQWLAGAAVFVYDYEKFIPDDMLTKISSFGVTSFCAPPTIYRFLIREDFSKYDLSKLKWAAVAGEPLNPVVYDTFFSLTGLKLREGFGQTETTLQIATFPWMEPKPGSMGIPSPQFDVHLIDSENKDCEDGEVGQIVIRTCEKIPIGLFSGYYKDVEKTESCHYGGLYYTGDLAWRDEDGYYWFVGRVDDVIKSSGYRIGPFEVESALMTHPAVIECAVTGAPDEIRGQVVKATIILAPEYRPGDEELAKEIQEHVKTVTAPYKYPRIVEFVTELPKTISGKIRRVEIRERSKS
jgi:acetyl-CoA synthetase